MKMTYREEEQKTYVEFFDRTSVENICACLISTPKSVVLVGTDEKELNRVICIYEKMFEKRNRTVRFAKELLPNWNTEEIIKTLEKIRNEHENCIFGITGGEERVIYALGRLSERYGDIQVHRVNIQDNEVYDCDMDGKTIEHGVPQLSVEENIRIYGGKIMYGDVHSERTYTWDLEKDDFETDIQAMWEICRDYFRPWNKQTGAFKHMVEDGTTNEDGIVVTAKKPDGKSYYINEDVRKRLEEARLATIEIGTDKTYTVTYKNLQVKRCLTQEGLALELKVYLTAKRLGGETPIYNDVVNGVLIDWDGIPPKKEKEHANTKNEIDVLAMHNMIPIFISCKNRDYMEIDELYKLSTVADRFGGKYAKKVLVVRELKDDKFRETLLQRAKDMEIEVIIGTDITNDDHLKDRLEKMWEPENDPTRKRKKQ